MGNEGIGSMENKMMTQILEELNSRGQAPELKALRSGEGFTPSVQNKMAEESGLWPYLQIWDGRQLKLELEQEG